MSERSRIRQIASNEQFLLASLIDNPVGVAAFYRLTRRYSARNRLLLITQMRERNIPLGPIGTFKEWRNAGNPVAQGQKGLYIVVPRERRVRRITEVQDEPDGTFIWTDFTAVPRIFGLSQTITPNTHYSIPELPSVNPPSLREMLNLSSEATLPLPSNTVDSWYDFLLIISHLLMNHRIYGELKDSSDVLTQEDLDNYYGAIVALVTLLNIAGEAAIQESSRIQSVREKTYNFLQTKTLPPRLNLIGYVNRLLNMLFPII